ncbi:MAG: PH domain-containing protein [Deltaproteobacteria bacterium]|nr:PH domain-containing protein [Deltaproteobacteria bacterium]
MRKDNANIIYHTSFLHFLPLLIAALAAAVFAFYASFEWKWSVQWAEIGGYTVPLPLFGLPAIVLMVMLICRKYNEKLILTPEYVLFIEGIIRWKQESVRMDYASIKEVTIEETILQRLLGLGDVCCLTAAASAAHKTATMPGVRSPRKIKDLIMERVRIAQKEVRGDFA